MNKYDILETIGEGAYGMVVKARNRETGEVVAIKRFKESEDDEAVKKTSVREVKLLRLMKDEPYIVTLVEAFRRKGRLYLVFPFVGKNLLEELESQPQGLDPEAVRRMVFSLLAALYACHSKGVIHRDIKPENLLVHGDGTLRLCDFGFARPYAKGDKDLTDYVATRWYRSPELLLGTSDYGLPSDLWAVGCIMAEMLDGQALFPGETELDQLFLIQNMLGSLTNEQLATFRSNPRFAQNAIPSGPARPDCSLDRRFQGKRLGKRAIPFLKALIQINPTNRPTVEEAMRNPYFEGLCDAICPQLKSILQPDILSHAPLGTGRPPSPDRLGASRPSTAGQPLRALPLSFEPDGGMAHPQQPLPQPGGPLRAQVAASPSTGAGLPMAAVPPACGAVLTQSSSVGLLPRRLGSGHHRPRGSQNASLLPSQTQGSCGVQVQPRTRSESSGRDGAGNQDSDTERKPAQSQPINAGPSIPPMTSGRQEQTAASYTYQPLVIGARHSTNALGSSRGNLPRISAAHASGPVASTGSTALRTSVHSTTTTMDGAPPAAAFTYMMRSQPRR